MVVYIQFRSGAQFAPDFRAKYALDPQGRAKWSS
jgi:hypothetical protein